MDWYNNLGTRAKLFLGFGIMWLMLVAVVVVAYWNITMFADSSKELRDVGTVKAITLQKLRAHENHNRAAILEMILSSSKERQKDQEKKIRARAAGIQKMIALLFRLEHDPRSRARVQELSGLLEQYRKNRDQQIDLIHQGKIEEVRKLATEVQGGLFSQIWSIMDELGRKENLRLDKMMEHDLRLASRAEGLFIILGVASLILGLLMVQVLNRTVAEISLAVSQLGSTASEIQTATTQVASGTAETAAAISQTTATVEEVRQGAQLSNKKAQDVSTSAQNVSQVSQDGKKAVDEAVGGMRRIREEMESIAKTIVFLSEQSQSIGGIIATVTDLTDQSNLLAVNAAIEAAKAGEQGKGFAVVAQEIKNLAEQSKQATTQVRTILSDIQKATSSAVMATEQGSKAVEAGSTQFNQAGETIRTLADSTGQAAQAAAQIAASSQQQMVGMDQMGMAMENIDQAGNQTVAAMRQVETAAQDLNELGQRLKRLVKGRKNSKR